MLSWEYPPRIIGGLARHVYALANELAKLGVSVYVLSLAPNSESKLPLKSKYENLIIKTIKPPSSEKENFVDWVYLFNISFMKEAVDIIDNWHPSLIHAHDWLVAPCAVALKYLKKLPLISTIHSTEYGRSGGLIKNDIQQYIHKMELLLSSESSEIIVASQSMKKEIFSLFNATDDHVSIIPNGIYMNKNDDIKMGLDDLLSIRNKYALPGERLVLFVGRLFHQKGPQVLLSSAHNLLQHDQNYKFVFVGEGPLKPSLVAESKRLGIESKVYFAGFLDDKELYNLYKVADVASFPSLYEPFGIVCLEAMSAGCPVVASNIGGLGEIISDGIHGLLVPPGDVEALSRAIRKISTSKIYSRYLGKNGLKEIISKYNWENIAEKTLHAYNKSIDVRNIVYQK